MTKQEVIKEAYGEYFEKCNPDKDGWAKEYTLPQEKIRGGLYRDLLEVEWKHGKYGNPMFRPKSLAGLETNNGWTKIESEFDLPSDQNAHYNLCHISKDGYLPNESFNILKSFWETGIITHYQSTTKIEKPLW